MKIQVTQKHINQGTPNWGLGCPVALACQEAQLVEVLVGKNHIYWGADGKSVITPRSVQRFIRAFDNGQPVQPFNFILKAE